MSKDYTLHHGDCMDVMRDMPDGSVGLTLTDIPYDIRLKKSIDSRGEGAIRVMRKGKANDLTFDIPTFLKELDRITTSTIIIFCGKEQFSGIYEYFNAQQVESKGTARQIVWEKTNPAPIIGQYVYLTGIENAVWYKKRDGVFNAFCKNPVFKTPCGSSELHPTEKHHGLLDALILDNSNPGDVVFDPCAGSGSTGIVAIGANRRFIGIEIDREYYELANKRISSAQRGLL